MQYCNVKGITTCIDWIPDIQFKDILRVILFCLIKNLKTQKLLLVQVGLVSDYDLLALDSVSGKFSSW